MSNSKAYSYAMEQYEKYNLGLSSKYEMMCLLNILEAHAETLDSLHDRNGLKDGFCDLVVTGSDGFFTDAEIAAAVMETNSFFTSKEEFIGDDKEARELFFELLDCSNMVKTTDGYVELDVV